MRLIGYVTSRTFQGLTIPVPAQNSCLREYAKANQLIYVLPPLEHYFENCYMQLFTALESLEERDILGIYSAAMLPFNNKKLRNIFDCIERKKCSIYCVLETKRINNYNEAKRILFSYYLKNIFDNMHQIDINSLRKLAGKNF